MHVFCFMKTANLAFPRMQFSKTFLTVLFCLYLKPQDEVLLGKKKTSQKDGAGAQTLTLACCSPGNIGTISLREQNEHFSSTKGFKAEIKAFTGGIYCTM